jgi:hypothetical protein
MFDPFHIGVRDVVYEASLPSLQRLNAEHQILRIVFALRNEEDHEVQAAIEQCQVSKDLRDEAILGGLRKYIHSKKPTSQDLIFLRLKLLSIDQSKLACLIDDLLDQGYVTLLTDLLTNGTIPLAPNTRCAGKSRAALELKLLELIYPRSDNSDGRLLAQQFFRAVKLRLPSLISPSFEARVREAFRTILVEELTKPQLMSPRKNYGAIIDSFGEDIISDEVLDAAKKASQELEEKYSTHGYALHKEWAHEIGGLFLDHASEKRAA